jgi:hypothetical protein
MNINSYKIYHIFLLMPAFVWIVSCHKTDHTAASYQLSETDAAAMIANDLLPQYGGLIAQLSNCAGLSQSAKNYCGIQKDSILKNNNPATAYVIYSYNALWHYTYNCANQYLIIAFNGTCNYDGSTFTANDQYSGTFNLSGPSASNYQLGLSQKRSGKQRLKGIAMPAINTTLECQSDNVLIDQTLKKVRSGSVTLRFSGDHFNYNGTFTFTGGSKGVLVLNSGKTYPVSW